MWTAFHFLRPWWLLAIVPAAALLYLLARHKYRRGDWTSVCDAELLPFILQDKPDRIRPGGWFGAALACLLCILALAGPTWERLPSPAFRNDSALVIALDLSQSMNATDIKPSRISRARYKISDILQQRKDGQTALLVYSGDAFTVTPLTTDTATINSQIEALTTDIMPSPGSNTGVAIEKAADLLHQAGLAQGDILLVTDGADADGARQAGRLLGGYRLSVLALGSPEGAPIPLPGGGFLKDARGNIVLARLDSAALSQLAADGHGIFQQVTADDADIERLGGLFNQVKRNDPNQKTDLMLEQWHEAGPWLLLLVLPWAALHFRKGLLALALLCLLPLPRPASALDWHSLWQTPDQRGQQAFRQQQFQQAAEQFDNPDWRAAAQYKAGRFQEAAETLKDTRSADGHYNRGNALAKTGQLQEALQAYREALKLDPNHADAKYNKELLEKQQQEQQKQQNRDRQSSDPSSEQNKPQDRQNEQAEQSKPERNQDQSRRPNQDQQPQKPDQSQSQTADKPEQTEDKQPQPEQQTDKPDDARREPKKPQPNQSSSQEQAARPATELDETKRANQQLLKRIPDEPTGLLKRKFKYQYGQRAPPPHSGPDW